jgi:hypothetical protein
MLAMSLIAVAFAGCTDETLDSKLKELNVKQGVIYYANGGWFDGDSSRDTKSIYYPENAALISDFSITENISITRTNYIFNGWLKAEVDENGDPVKDENGKVVASQEVIDLSTTKLEKGQILYVCANWVKGVTLKIYLVTDDNQPMTGADNKVYNPGDEIKELSFGTQSYINIKSETSYLTSTDYTYLQYYSDEACTQAFSGKYTKPADDGEAKLYAKYVKGNYEIVRDNYAVQTMLNSSDAVNYYIFNTDDSKIIDMSGLTVNIRTGTTNEFCGKIQGNGYTLKNITYALSDASTNNGVYSAFGKFAQGAEINDLAFENVTVSINKVRNTVTRLNIYLVSASTDSESKFNNFEIDGITLKISTMDETVTTIANIPKQDGVYSTANCLFGGYSSDEEFFAAYSGITVTDVNISIN